MKSTNRALHTVVAVGFALGTHACLAPKEMPASNLTPEHAVAVELRYASAAEVAELLNRLIAQAREASMRSPNRACVLYAPDGLPEPSPCAPSAWVSPRSNVVVVRMEAPEEEPRVRELIARLDSHGLSDSVDLSPDELGADCPASMSDASTRRADRFDTP